MIDHFVYFILDILVVDDESTPRILSTITNIYW